MPKKQTLSPNTNLNVNPAAKGTSIGQNVATNLTRVKSVPDVGGTGTIHKS